eukprot:TRINITY_DN46921_c0_g1_i1.p1 TRINITY_DN46921_c0_g1~~TRINITY_DN46921_c0_g1_i1.p1  ORF type:complete len:410 (+),score=112.98 TRINITY_DN46921_c0_g1_i1:47-1276(+)
MEPLRDQLERLPLPELLRVAASHGVDVSSAHDRRDVIAELAVLRQQQLRTFAASLREFGARLQGHKGELDKSQMEYQTTYDHVEQMITDRFAELHDQLLRKEVEVRGQLAILKNKGDDMLRECHESMNRELDSLQETVDKCKFQSRDQLDALDLSPVSEPVTVPVPQLTGRHFILADCGPLDLSQLRVALDLQKVTRSVQLNPQAAANPQFPRPVSQPMPAMHSQLGSDSALVTEQAPFGGRIGGWTRPAAPRLSFPTDREIDTIEQPGVGMTLRMIPDAVTDGLGTRALETFTEGVHTWRVQLDNVTETLLGLVDCRGTGSHVEDGNGFFWSPVRGEAHGQRGRPTAEFKRIRKARPRDRVRMEYDADAGTLRVRINELECGVICTDLKGEMSPCFIFARGESITLLY